MSILQSAKILTHQRCRLQVALDVRNNPLRNIPQEVFLTARKGSNATLTHNFTHISTTTL